MRFHTVVIVFLCAGALGSARAQISAAEAANYHVQNWNRGGGLPHDSITAIVQTRDGYLWLGTDLRGLVRYDGSRFVYFNTENTPALRSDRISCLLEDAQDGLWIGTEGGGVMRYKQGAFEALTDRRGLTDSSITVLAADREGNLWAGTAAGGIYEFRDGEFTGLPGLRSLPNQAVLSLIPSSERVWVAARDHYGYLEDGEFRFLNAEPLRSVVMGRALDDGVWLVENGALKKLDALGETVAQHGRFVPEREGVLATIVYEDRRGNVWIGTENHGLFRFAGNRFQRIGGLPSQWILCILEDREGNLWVGTKGGGLSRLKEPLFEIFNEASGLAARRVLSICEGRGGVVWIGTEGGGLHRLQGRTVERFKPELLQSESVFAVHEDTRTNLWVGTRDSGLFRFTGDSPKLYSPGISRSIQAIYEDQQGTIWIGTRDQGVTIIREDGFRHLTMGEGLPSNDVRAFQAAPDGSVWIGTGDGLARYHDGRFDVFRRTNGLPSDKIWTLYLDAENVLWAGTSGGLSRYDKGGFYNFTRAAHALHSDTILQIIDDGLGRLWIGSSDGIFRVNRTNVLQLVNGETNKLAPVVYGTFDGLPSEECTGGFQPAGCRTADGRLWFSTIDGAAVLDLARVRPNLRRPNVVIETFDVDGKPFPLTGVIRVPPGASRFEFTYTAFSYSAPRRIWFRYMLEGRDRTWSDVTPGRKVVYNDLPAGNYTFRVIAGNQDGLWNEIGKALQFTVLPPYWRTSWFWSLMGLLLIALAVTTYRLVAVLQLKRRLRELEQQHALERERARIAKDMHDDLGARLTQIGLIGELIRRDSGKQDVGDLADKLTRATREVSETVDEIVWAVNPKNDTLDKLVPYLLHYTEEFFDLSPIRYRLDAPSDLPPVPVKAEARHNLFLVLKESLNNTVKHAQSTEVRVRVAYEKPVLTLTVEDNGRGFDISETGPFRNGLANMRKRIEDIGGRFSLASQPGRGTQTRISLELK